MAGFSTTFQDTSDFVNFVSCGTGGGGSSCTYTQNTTGGNSYITTIDAAGVYSTYIQNKDPEQTTYAAATIISTVSIPASGGVGITLYDSGHNVQYNYVHKKAASYSRYEVKIIGGSAYVYRNSDLVAVSPALISNPYYVAFGSQYTGPGGVVTAKVDDFVYGTSESPYILSAPEEGAYILKKDMITPAASGFAWSNGTIISSYNMTTTWGKGTNTSETVILQNYGTGQTMCSHVTTSGTSAGSVQWPLQECIFNNPLATYGYYVTTISGSGEYSAVIPYLGSGASVTFNQASYTRGDTAILSYSIEGGYWDTGAYTYKIQTQDVFGNVWETDTVTTQTGSVSVDFADADQGVYYAILIATPIAGGDAIWMNYDSAEVSGYMKFVGGIYDAENETQITENVTVIINQDGLSDTTYTETGVYNSTDGMAFGTGSLTTFTVSASGYQTQVSSFVPMIAKTIVKNITLPRDPPTCPTGICLGGLANETIYSRPVANVTIAITNATYSESYTTSTNSVGWYNLGESNGVFLTNGRCYHVTASKTGYTGNTYLKCVVGS